MWFMFSLMVDFNREYCRTLDDDQMIVVRGFGDVYDQDFAGI